MSTYTYKCMLDNSHIISEKILWLQRRVFWSHFHGHEVLINTSGNIYKKQIITDCCL